MGTVVFRNRFWSWPLPNKGVRILQPHRVSTILPFLTNLHLLLYTTATQFYSSLLWCKLDLLYLLASMLYIFQSKTLFK